MTTTRTSGWTRGNVLGLAAIFLALSGTAYATHPGGANTISSGDIIDAEVRSPDLAPNSVGGGKIVDESVRSADIGTNQVTTGEIATNAVRSGDIAANHVLTSHLATGAVESTDVLDGSLTGTDVADGSLGGAELADLAVTIPKLAFDPATQSELNAHKNSDDHDGRYWTLEGNKGTVAGKQFLGTTDDEPLELWVNGARALRLEPAVDPGGPIPSPNVIGGISHNFVTAGVFAATIAGGGVNGANPAGANRVTDCFGTVGGGADNQAGDGAGTTCDQRWATVGGGIANDAMGTGATVSGGSGNEAFGDDATVPGGLDSVAGGNRSFAAGTEAKANHGGAFVWADNQAPDMASTADNQFIARASGDFFLQSDSTLDDQGGFLNTSTGAFLSTGGAWTNASDENLKSGFEPVGPRAVLDRVAELPVRSWHYDAEPGVSHLGPTAQDFHAAFGLGADERHIASVDADGVALAAIKGLERIVGSQRERLHAQRASLRSLRARVAALERRGQ